MKAIQAKHSTALQPKILVVDDTPANLVAMKRLLKTLNAELIMAHSGNEALALAISEDFAVILLDVNMPEMDGFEVAEHLSTADETHNIPIIFVTAVHHDKESILRGYATGAVDYVDKPIIPAILIGKIGVFLNMWTLKAGLENEIALRQDAELKIEHLAQHDALTKLPNRRQLQKELGNYIKLSNRKNEQFAVLFIDLDGFKNVNDDLGHDAGDTVLKIVSERLKECVRDTDIVARHGGDEFIILLSNVADALALRSRLEHLVGEVGSPISWQSGENHYEAHIGASIGVAIYPQHGKTTDTLLSSADEAMYLAKNNGKSTFRYYSEELNASMKRRILLDHHLRFAIEKNEFELHLQPIVKVETGKPVAAEALLRWNNHLLGNISPEEFIPVAESCSYINDIGLWVLSQTLFVMKKHPDLHVSINVSGKQLNNYRLKKAIEIAISECLLDAEKLEIEITEGVLLSESVEVDEQLKSINNLGVQLSLDDFGTGYSSLSHLKRCPVKTLKIDQSFITDIPHDEDSNTMVRAIIAMAKGLNINVVAEGVETQEQWDFLKEHKCSLAQGYYFSKPMSVNNFNKYMKP